MLNFLFVFSISFLHSEHIDTNKIKKIQSNLSQKNIFLEMMKYSIDKNIAAFKKKDPVISKDYLTFYNTRITNSKSKYNILVLSDYTCPFCQQTNNEINYLLKKSSKKFNIIHGLFPINSDCNNKIKNNKKTYSCISAYTAICAEKYNKFNEANDFLYKYSTIYSTKPSSLIDKIWTSRFIKRENQRLIEKTEENLNLKNNELKNCINSDYPKIKLQAELALFKNLKIKQTPFVLMNEKEISAHLLKKEDLFNYFLNKLEEN